MLSSILVNIIISIFAIYIIHSLWNYLKDTYTTKKTKDLVNSQIQKYKNMMEEIQQQKTSSPQDPFEMLDSKGLENDF